MEQLTASADYTPSQAEEEAIASIEEAGHDLGAIKAYRDNVGEQYAPLLEWEDWISDFEDSYQGKMDTREFAEQLADEEILSHAYNTEARDFISMYFDYDKWERDLFMGDYWESNGYIFRSI